MEYADENQTETWDENADFKTFGSLSFTKVADITHV